MTFTIVLVILVVLASLAIIASRFNVVERLRKDWQKALEDEESQEGLGELRKAAKSGVWEYVVGAVLVLLVRNAWGWRKAPDGSIEKLVWNIVLLAAIAVGLWLVIEQVDKRINRSSAALPDYSGTRTDDSIED